MQLQTLAILFTVIMAIMTIVTIVVQWKEEIKQNKRDKEIRLLLKRLEARDKSLHDFIETLDMDGL